jgi:hypothetical protein
MKIHEMVKACGLEDLSGEMAALIGVTPNRDRLIKFAEMVSASEREACAKVCENGHFLHEEAPDALFGKACTAAIRLRSNSNSS